ncbi:RNA polymerase-associated transcription specificity factor Rap94 [Salmon gill poxvirus]|nr:RNA polymerase-associated transcription specificity factor Rap94 [Salmon gill poxvirus]
MDDIIDVIIKKIRNFFHKSLELPNFDDFLEQEKVLFTNNLYGVQDMDMADIRLLFTTIYQNPETSDSELKEVFVNKGQIFEKDVVISLSYDLYHSENNLVKPFFNWVWNSLEIITRPKQIWSMEHNSTVHILKNHKPDSGKMSSSLSGKLTSKIISVPINFETLLSHLIVNYPKYSFNKNFIEFKFGSRNIGVNVTRSKPKFPHVVEFNINPKTNELIMFRIDDNVACKNMELRHEGHVVPIRTTFALDDSTFDVLTKALISTFDATYITKYVSLAFMIKHLNDFYVFFLAKDVQTRLSGVSKITYREKTPTVEIDFPKIWKQSRTLKQMPCEHTSLLKEILKPSPDQFDNLQKFSEKYIHTIDQMTVCNICGEFLQMFNEQFSEIKKINGKIVIPVFTNIFSNEPYSQFVKGQRVLSDYIMSFDNIFKTKRWNYNGNIYKMVLDQMIEIDKHKIEYQARYKNEIQKGLFFVRLAANLFETKSDELFYKAKTTNISVLIALGIIGTMNLDEFMSVITNRNQLVEYVKAGTDQSLTERLFKNTCLDIIFEFLLKIKFIDKVDRPMIETIFEFYYYHLTPELQSLFKILKEDVVIGVVTVVGTNIYKDYASNIIREKETSEIININDNYMIRNIPTTEQVNIEVTPESYQFDKYDGHEFSLDSDVIVKEYEYIKSNIEYALSYNGRIVMDHGFTEKQVYIMSHNGKKKIIDREIVCDTSPLKYEGNMFMAFLKFGDPFPFSDTISEKHLNIKMVGWNYIALRIFNIDVPLYYFGVETENGDYIRNDVELWWTGIIMYYLKLSSIKQCLIDNDENIKILYKDFL